MRTITTTDGTQIQGATLKVYPGAPHGLCSTHKDQVNAELLAFFKA
jgi:non-heme chloroperoxidase